ncbi:cytochrome P450 [Aspergillus sclerotiicarbonarius CBS 121057]|uniref:Cytochrome P450 n=1 Tax=Aspergillus sclerotiicarbonarius (strain CBS 121057 / IBT 28362) TaxID=1448318 RepID=A0A319ERM2_ASPSB|nr:cytochrome P450 [Aspergillus sclerotiicarbonarius CBS 121057]
MFATLLKALLLLLFLVLVGHVSYVSLVRPWLTNDPNAIKNPAQCRLVIAGDGQFIGKRNLLSPLKSRALSNSKIQAAFGIHNAFTSGETDFVAQFVARAKEFINVKADDWDKMARQLQDAAQVWVEHPDGEVHLASMAQSLTLRFMMLTVFKFKFNPPHTTNSYLAGFARAIHQAWVLARDESRLIRFHHNHVLRDNITAFFPAYDFTQATGNPLNYILPGFETTWRVVLRMFLEIRRARNQDWIDTLVFFAYDPTKAQFHDKAHGISVEHLVMEGLRLYPPTRHIHRTFHFDNEKQNTVEEVSYSADIEACHLSKKIWGRDALEYNPYRWAKLTKEQNDAFMAFGSAPFECPAKPVFGPRMIGLLVSTMVSEVEERGTWRLVGRDKQSAYEYVKGIRLDNDRAAYDDLFLYLNDDGEEEW